MFGQFEKLLRTAIEKEASDIYLKAHNVPYLRLQSEPRPEGKEVLEPADIKTIADSLMNADQKKSFAATKEANFAITLEDGYRFRVNIFEQRASIGIVLRLIKNKIPPFHELNLPEKVLCRLCSEKHGLILLTGPTGCGKSTTLASMIDYINQNYAKHIVTIEDPIEYLFNDKKSIIEQREVGLDTLSYHEALKNVLRQTPDVILIGDILSLETMQIALKAAETGHLVLSTLHTTSTVHAIERIVSFFPPHQHDEIRMQVSLLFKGIISQRLINRFEAKGRVPACEILVSTPTVRSLILEGKTNEIYPLIHDGGFYGMQTFNQSLVKFYKDKRVSLEEIKNNTDNPEELELFLKGFYSAKEEGTQRF